MVKDIEIMLMEKLKDKKVASVCQAICDAANNFCLKYCNRNDVQHVSSNVGIAAELRDSEYGNLNVEDLVKHRYQFGELRGLLFEVILPRGLVQNGFDAYNRKTPSVEFKPYSTIEEFVKLVA